MREPAQRVVGLSYGGESGRVLPRLVLKGSGPAAGDIRNAFVRRHGVHRVVRDDALVDKLFQLPTDAEISPDLYRLVALLLVHVFAVEAHLRSNRDA
jgi:type III secretion system FlhB-like substrate exporter